MFPSNPDNAETVKGALPVHAQLPLSGSFDPQVQSSMGTREVNTPARPTVLWVDDDDDLRYVIGLTLSMMGLHVISCPDAGLASTAFRSRNDIDLLITDLEMPGRSGVELARELCALSSSLPVLIVSGAFLSQELTSELQDRDWRFLAKPYAINALMTNVYALLPPGADQQHAA